MTDTAISPVSLAFYENNRDSNPGVAEWTWAELVEALTSFSETDCNPCPGKECKAKYGWAWSPVEFGANPRRRANENVNAITVGVFDLDHLSEQSLLEVAHRIEGYEYIIHSTHSHRPPANQCFRLVMPLSKPVPAAQWRDFLRTIVALLALPADPQCKDLSRLYFLPTVPHGRERLAVHGRGTPLDVDRILASVVQPRNSAPTASTDPGDAPSPEPEGPIDLASLVDVLKATRRRYNNTDPEKYDLVDRILRKKPLADVGARDASIHKGASILGYALPTGTPTDAALEIMRTSIATMPTAPEGLDYWITKARFSYERAMDRRVAGDEKRAKENAEIQARMRAMTTAPRLTDEEMKEDPEAWKKFLYRKGDDTLQSIGINAAIILDHDPRTRGTLRFNEITKNIDILPESPFAGHSPSTLPTAVSNWLVQHYDFSVQFGDLERQLLLIARLNAYNPLIDWLNGLVWDGQPRADSWLVKYLGAQTADGAGVDILDHLHRIGARWLISAVARALDPGCKVDTILVLEGRQGIKKSSAFHTLGGAWFCDTQLTLGDKDSRMLAAGSWIIELAELASFKRSETEAQKAFFTSRTDRFRPPYGRAVEEFARRCVFVGTTNDETYLMDLTGNRRYWPVKCDGIDLEALQRDRAQLWAEAVARYRAGEKWWLEEEEQIIAESLAEERMAASPLDVQIAEWWSSLAKRPEFLRTHEVAENVLKFTPDRITRALSVEVGWALRRIGFVRRRRRVLGVPSWVYEPTQELRDAPVGRGDRHLRAIAGAQVKP